MMVSFNAVLFPRDVLDEILDLIESVSEGFPTYSFKFRSFNEKSGAGRDEPEHAYSDITE